MAKAAALVITGISIALLVIYGADAAVGMDDPDKQGFLDMDHMTRGLGLGGPAMVLPLIAYFISRNDSSKGLGGMILVAGILIIIGAVTVIGMTDFSEADETARNPLMEIAPLLIVGGIQMGLGVLKIKKS
jgi:amino acid transporter